MALGTGMSAASGYVDDVKGVELFGYPECPYCRRVLNAITVLQIDVPLRNTMTDGAANAMLLEATGRETVPVLRIEMRDGTVRWLPESLDIVRFLTDRFDRETKFLEG